MNEGREKAGRLNGDILRNTVKWGTGRRAKRAVTVGESVVPLAGKTGTTNDYKNAAFVGFVPRLTGGQWSWADGYTLGVYVGYDDHARQMVKGRIRLDGASGALPAWIGTAQGLATQGMLGEGDALSAEMAVESSFGRVGAEDKSGLPQIEEGELVEGRKFDPVGDQMTILIGLDDGIIREIEGDAAAVEPDVLEINPPEGEVEVYIGGGSAGEGDLSGADPEALP